MKKVILSVIALSLGGFAFGQVAGAPSTTTPETPLPGAGADANVGTSIQFGNNNRVQVRQAGTRQSVFTRQDDGDGTGGNLARLMQTGEVQAGSGVENLATVLQSGTANQSTTVQEGDFNNAFMAQGQNNLSSEGNLGYIQQGTGQQAEGNFAAMEQDGNDNQATIVQTYDNSDAWTRQDGDDNRSLIKQDAGPNQTAGHEAWNLQEGNGNASTIDQSGNGARNFADTRQLGDDNKALQVQVATAPDGGVGNTASIDQGDLPWTTDDGSNGASAYQNQNGEGNSADIYQRAGGVTGVNIAEQYQDGTDNSAEIRMNHGNYGGGDNYARQDQVGANNDALIQTNGVGQSVLQTQEGEGNIAYSNQIGRGNMMNIHQRGDANEAESYQWGQYNVGLIVQRDGQSYSLHQGNVPGGPQPPNGSAIGNQADILQLGPNGDFSTDGIPFGFDAPFAIPAIPDVSAFTLPDIN
jgi:hypothetical protein